MAYQSYIINYSRVCWFRKIIFQSFCEYIRIIKCSKEEISKFLSYISNNPRAFSVDKKETFVEKRQRIADMAKEIGILHIVMSFLVSFWSAPQQLYRSDHWRKQSNYNKKSQSAFKKVYRVIKRIIRGWLYRCGGSG